MAPPTETADARLSRYRQDFTHLVRVATLLVGDEAAAIDVVEDAFVRTAGVHDGAAPSLREVRCAVFAGVRRRGCVAGASDASPAGAVLAALAGLPADQRAALVLVEHGALADDDVAHAAGATIDEVQARAVAGRRALDAAGVLAGAPALAVVLRDRADLVRARPDVDRVRGRLAKAAADPIAGPTVELPALDARAGRRPGRRPVAAAACSVLVLGATVLAFAAGGDGPAAPVGAARHAGSAEPASAEPTTGPDATDPSSTVPSSTGAPDGAAATSAVALPETAAPAAEVPRVAGAAPVVDEPATNELVPVPTTTPPPPQPVAEAPAPAESAPPTTAPRRASTTTTKVPRATTTTLVRFTVVQKWRTSSASPPYEDFSGTADPGATITVTSAYGTGSTKADAAGRWSVRVTFPTAPVGVAFTGKVRTAQGVRSFTFTRVSAP